MAQFRRISARGRAVALILAIGTGALGAGVARSLAPASAKGAAPPLTTSTPTVVVTHPASLKYVAAGTTGTVTFFLDGAQVPGAAGTKNLTGKNSVNAAFTMNSVGDHVFTAQWSGSAVRSNPVTIHVVTAGATPATVTVTSNIGNSIPSGTALVLTAHVSGAPAPAPAPGGTVTFTNGTVTLGGSSRAVVNGAASANVASLPLGTNTITANYTGDGTYAPATGTVVITVTPTSNDKWLQHMYTDMIGSQDPAGEAFWSSQLNKGLPRYTAAYAFTQSQGYLMNLVSKLYLAEMGRPVDTPGGNFWVGQLQKGLPPEGFAASLVGSDEMFNSPSYGQANVDTYIGRVYQSMLGRNEDAAGAAFWHDFLIGGGPRWKLTLDFAYSKEWATTTVTRMYTQFHLGTPDPASLDYWVGRILSGMTDAELAANIGSSPQYYDWTQAN